MRLLYREMTRIRRRFFRNWTVATARAWRELVLERLKMIRIARAMDRMKDLGSRPLLIGPRVAAEIQQQPAGYRGWRPVNVGGYQPLVKKPFPKNRPEGRKMRFRGASFTGIGGWKRAMLARVPWPGGPG